MGPVRQNPIQRTVRTAHLMCLWLCTTFSTQYSTEQVWYLLSYLMAAEVQTSHNESSKWLENYSVNFAVSGTILKFKVKVCELHNYGNDSNTDTRVVMQSAYARMIHNTRSATGCFDNQSSSVTVNCVGGTTLHTHKAISVSIYHTIMNNTFYTNSAILHVATYCTGQLLLRTEQTYKASQKRNILKSLLTPLHDATKRHYQNVLLANQATAGTCDLDRLLALCVL